MKELIELDFGLNLLSNSEVVEAITCMLHQKPPHTRGLKQKERIFSNSREIEKLSTTISAVEAHIKERLEIQAEPVIDSADADEHEVIVRILIKLQLLDTMKERYPEYIQLLNRISSNKH
jgi:hypothetical protein